MDIVSCTDMFCCWAQSAGAGAAGQAAWAGQPKHGLVHLQVHGLLQQEAYFHAGTGAAHTIRAC